MKINNIRNLQNEKISSKASEGGPSSLSLSITNKFAERPNEVGCGAREKIR